VRYAHELLFGQGIAQSTYDKGILDNYFAYGWWALLAAWVMLEVGGFTLIRRYRAKPDEYPEFQARLQRLAAEAGVRPPTLVVLRGMGRVLNAAATQSILNGTQDRRGGRHRRDADRRGGDLCHRARAEPHQASRHRGRRPHRRGQQRHRHPEVGHR